MRLIFCNHEHTLTRDILSAMSKKVQLDAVDIIEGPGFDPPAGLNCRYFSREDLYFSRYDIDWSTVPPLDQEILDTLFAAVVNGELMYLRNDKYHNKLRFMNNIEAANEIITLDKLGGSTNYKLAFFRHVRFWRDRILKTRPDAMIHVYGTPHLFVEYIIWQLCKSMNIPCVWLMPTNVFPKMLVMTDLDVSRPDLNAALNRHLKAWHDSAFVPEVDRYVERFIDEQLNKGADPHPKYIDRDVLLRSRGRTTGSMMTIARAILRDVLDSISGRRTVRFAWFKHRLYWDLVRADSALDRRYDRLSKGPDVDEKFIYLALHYTPEESSAPKGGVYANQILIAEMISYNLPKGWKLYVKEHPAQGSYGRESYLYDELARLPGVVLVERNTNTFDLIRKCRAVATIAGTAGIEALVRGKPVLTFGAAFYSCAPGSFRIRTAHDCATAMERICDGTYENSSESMRCFLRALQDCAIDAVIPNTGDPKWDDFPSREKICDNIASAFVRVLNELGKCGETMLSRRSVQADQA